MSARTHIGVTLEYSTNGSSYTALGNVTKLHVPEVTVKDVDATHLSSSNNCDEFLPGFILSGTMEFEVNHLYDISNTIDDYVHARQMLYLRVTLVGDHSSSDSTLVLYGYFNKWRLLDELTPGKTTSVRSTLGFKCSGKNLYTPAT